MTFEERPSEEQLDDIKRAIAAGLGLNVDQVTVRVLDAKSGTDVEVVVNELDVTTATDVISDLSTVQSIVSMIEDYATSTGSDMSSLTQGMEIAEAPGQKGTCHAGVCATDHTLMGNRPAFCAAETCTQAECCVPKGTCDSSVCGMGHTIKDQANLPIHCAGHACREDECCTDVCVPNPCKNEGTCVDGIRAFTCNCATGYSGTTCDAADESSNTPLIAGLLAGGVCAMGLAAAAMFMWRKKSMQAKKESDMSKDPESAML